MNYSSNLKLASSLVAGIVSGVVIGNVITIKKVKNE